MFGNKWCINTSFPSIANLKCTPSNRQMYPKGYMYPRMGNPVLDVEALHKGNWENVATEKTSGEEFVPSATVFQDLALNEF